MSAKNAAAKELLDRLVAVARYIEDNAAERHTLESLAPRAGLSPVQLQRRFKAAFGVTPKAYQEGVRLGQLKKALRTEEGITEAIFSAGYGSISRVYGESRRQMGMRPGSYRKGAEGEHIAYATRETSLGLLLMAATQKGVCFVQFGEDEATLHHMLREEFPKALLSPSPAQPAESSPSPKGASDEMAANALDHWIQALDSHISDHSPKPDIPLDMQGTAHQIKVWNFLLSVREGETLSYRELAERTGNPKAARAVASACAKNRIAVLIPCHRVLRGDGSLGGYRWGLGRKKTLLEAEKRLSGQ